MSMSYDATPYSMRAVDVEPVVMEIGTNEIEPGKAFFLLWIEGAVKPPKVKFAKLETAEQVAQAFARKVRRPVHVLKSLMVVEVQPEPILTTKLED